MSADGRTVNRWETTTRGAVTLFIILDLRRDRYSLCANQSIYLNMWNGGDVCVCVRMCAIETGNFQFFCDIIVSFKLSEHWC